MEKLKTNITFVFDDLEDPKELVDFTPREKKRKLSKIVTVKKKKNGRKDRKLF